MRRPVPILSANAAKIARHREDGMPAIRTAMPMAIISLAIVALPGAQIARANDVEKFFAGKGSVHGDGVILPAQPV